MNCKKYLLSIVVILFQLTVSLAVADTFTMPKDSKTENGWCGKRVELSLKGSDQGHWQSLRNKNKYLVNQRLSSSVKIVREQCSQVEELRVNLLEPGDGPLDYRTDGQVVIDMKKELGDYDLSKATSLVNKENERLEFERDWLIESLAKTLYDMLKKIAVPVWDFYYAKLNKLKKNIISELKSIYAWLGKAIEEFIIGAVLVLLSLAITIHLFGRGIYPFVLTILVIIGTAVASQLGLNIDVGLIKKTVLIGITIWEVIVLFFNDDTVYAKTKYVIAYILTLVLVESILPS